MAKLIVFEKELQGAVEGIVKEVIEYESDTFSAAGSKITRKEAEQVVAVILAGLWEDRIDGGMIADQLYEIRPEEVEEDDEDEEESDAE